MIVSGKSLMPRHSVPLMVPAMKSSIAAVSAKNRSSHRGGWYLGEFRTTGAHHVPEISALPVLITIFIGLVGVVYHDMNRRINANEKAKIDLYDAIKELRELLETKAETLRKEREQLAVDVRRDINENFRELSDKLTEVKAAVLGIGPTGEGGMINEVRKLREYSHTLDNTISVLDRRVYVVETSKSA